MSSMREKWQTDVKQVEELAAVAGSHLHCTRQHFCRPCAIGLALLALRCWPCRHKARRNARVALAWYNIVRRTGYCCRSSSSIQSSTHCYGITCYWSCIHKRMHSYMYCAVMCAIGTHSFDALRASLFMAHSSDQLGQVLMHNTIQGCVLGSLQVAKTTCCSVVHWIFTVFLSNLCFACYLAACLQETWSRARGTS
jgi:hypothetical protein